MHTETTRTRYRETDRHTHMCHITIRLHVQAQIHEMPHTDTHNINKGTT